MLCTAVHGLEKALVLKTSVLGTFIRWTALVLPSLFASLVSAQPNLTPYQPAGWTDKIVVSNVTGFTPTNAVDARQLSPTDTLYVNWAIVNDGTAATPSVVDYELEIDGIAKATWQTEEPLLAGYYNSVNNFSIGLLAAGIHQLKLRADTANTIAQSPFEKQYTKTITVIGARLPRLLAFRSAPTGPGPLTFNAPTEIDPAPLGAWYSYSFCRPTPTGLCGTFPATTNPTGGNPPYHFQLGTGVGFPPIGISLSLNGILSGTPSIPGLRAFSVCAVDLSANSICRNVSLNVTEPPTVAFTVNPVTVAPGQSFTLTWTTTNATSVFINGVRQPVSGSVALSIAAAGTYAYTLTASGPGGTTTARVTVTVTGGGSGYTYANWNCNGGPQCISVMGHDVGSAGPFCSSTACDAWRREFFPGATCTAQPLYPVYAQPPPGSSCSNYPN
jgi:hypothetical protein